MTLTQKQRESIHAAFNTLEAAQERFAKLADQFERSNTDWEEDMGWAVVKIADIRSGLWHRLDVAGENPRKSRGSARIAEGARG